MNERLDQDAPISEPQASCKVTATWTDTGKLVWGQDGKPIPGIKMPDQTIGGMKLG